MRARQHGFSLLEAIVALTILASAMLGAYAWVATDLGALGRVRDLALEEAALQQAMAELEQLDLASTPSGSLEWRDYHIDWRAEPFEPTRQGRTGVGGLGLYDFTLYRVALEVMHRDRLLGTPELRMLKFAPAREPGEAP